MLDPTYLLSLGQMNSELEQILAKQPYVGIQPTSSVKAIRGARTAAREALAATRAAETADTAPFYEEEDILVAMRDGHQITCRVHRPASHNNDAGTNGSSGGYPLFVMYHGGGFVLGDLTSEEWLCREWARLGGVAVNVDYRLAPEWRFPTAINDGEDSLKWVAENLQRLGADPAKAFVIGGISAGANITAVVSHLYRDAGLSPKPTGLWLSIPALMFGDAVPEKYRSVYLSNQQCNEAPILNKYSLAWFDSHNQATPDSPLRSPIAFPSHAGMPPTYFQLCGMDPLRDDGFIYDEILREEYGTKTKVDVYPGLPHAFWSTWPEASFSKAFRDDCIVTLQWFLNGSKD